MAPGEQPTLSIEVVYSPGPGRVECVPLVLEAGSTVAQAVAASGLLQRHPALQSAAGLGCGVWGAVCDATRLLHDRDRVELYRPLTADPKDARRRRMRKGA